MVQNKLSFGQSDLPSINMPSFVGLRPIIFDEEDFDLVHEFIAKHEFHEYRVHKKIELKGKKSISDSMLRGSIYHELRERFYKGQRVTWISLNADHAITRREESEITSSIRQCYMIVKWATKQNQLSTLFITLVGQVQLR